MENNFISEEDKVVLRKVAKYLKSYNMRQGVIQIENDYYRDPEDLIRNLSNFSNNWSVEIPDFFRPYLSEIIEKSLKNLERFDMDNISYDHIDLEISSDSNTLWITRYYGYEEPGDSNGLTWGDDTEDTELVTRLLNEIKESGAEPDDDGILQLDFNGSGDSGYLEGEFSSGSGRVPAHIEDWCYEVLENNFGGWEINEGSQGYFIFNVKNRIIELEITMNQMVEESDEILSVNFGKSKE
jgi:hypothetical protein